jgi:hypothetical protein
MENPGMIKRSSTWPHDLSIEFFSAFIGIWASYVVIDPFNFWYASGVLVAVSIPIYLLAHAFLAARKSPKYRFYLYVSTGFGCAGALTAIRVLCELLEVDPRPSIDKLIFLGLIFFVWIAFTELGYIRIDMDKSQNEKIWRIP